MKNEIRYTGQKMLDILPENLLPQIKTAFQDFDLNFEEDIKDCQIIINQGKGSCFLMYKHVDEFQKGDLLCTFHIEGWGFHWGKPNLHWFEKD